MNNFVFNRTASELKTSIYAQSPNTGVKPLQLDGNDDLEVVVSQITAPVTISNASFTLSGPITVASITAPVAVSGIASPVTIGNSTITVAGTVNISNASISTSVISHGFMHDTFVSQAVTGNQIIFPNKDMSNFTSATYFIYNSNLTTITLSLQISPTTTDDHYISDPNYTDVEIPQNTKKIIPVVYFGEYSRLRCKMGSATGTMTAYFNGQI